MDIKMQYQRIRLLSDLYGNESPHFWKKIYLTVSVYVLGLSIN